MTGLFPFAQTNRTSLEHFSWYLNWSFFNFLQLAGFGHPGDIVNNFFPCFSRYHSNNNKWFHLQFSQIYLLNFFLNFATHPHIQHDISCLYQQTRASIKILNAKVAAEEHLWGWWGPHRWGASKIAGTKEIALLHVSLGCKKPPMQAAVRQGVLLVPSEMDATNCISPECSAALDTNNFQMSPCFGSFSWCSWRSLKWG